MIKDPAPRLCDNPNFLLLFQAHVASPMVRELLQVLWVLTVHCAGGRNVTPRHPVPVPGARPPPCTDWPRLGLCPFLTVAQAGGGTSLTWIHHGPLPNPEPGRRNQPGPSRGCHVMRRLQELLGRGLSPLCHRGVAQPMDSLISTLVTQLPPYRDAHVPRTQVTAGSSSKKASARTGARYGRPLLTLTHSGEGAWCPGPQRE